ncbi:MAG: YeeE/YedE family protein [Proteobacteria bacterium]|nr:YeeE/YedE family protein [Pseudomonadota bacterium]MBU1648493.1 YeeE/YedE family protein [Pseudomonadota bacterium]
MLTASTFLIYAVGGLIGLLAGFLMHRSDYCVAGMFRDTFLFRDSFRLRFLCIQLIVTMFFFEFFRMLGLLPLYPFPLLGFASAANIIGGFIFGIGMVMAGGCVVGTLYKMGAGSVISAVAFIGLIAGSALYAEFHPWWASFAKATIFFPSAKTLPELFGVNPALLFLPTASISALIFIKWHKENKIVRQSEVKGYIQPWKTAVALALFALVSYVLIGMPLGITIAYAKIAAMIESLLIPEHFSTVTFFQLTPLNITHPSTGALLQGGAGPQIDSLWAIQFPLIAGIVLGSTFSAMLLGEFSITYKVPRRQLIMGLVGGILLGISARMSPGCNVWHLMGGLPILALQSLLFLFGLIPGTWVGSKILAHIILKQSMQPTGNN